MLETKPRKLINLGEVWQLGDHRIICGDATDPEIIKKVIGGVLSEKFCAIPHTAWPTWKTRHISKKQLVPICRSPS